jgi:hypothetical protein
MSRSVSPDTKRQTRMGWFPSAGSDIRAGCLSEFASRDAGTSLKTIQVDRELAEVDAVRSPHQADEFPTREPATVGGVISANMPRIKCETDPVRRRLQ